MEITTSYTLGKMSLKNRIVMAPLTRSRAINNVPNDLMKTYYEQRAGAGLIISEGTSPSVNGVGYARIPGAYTPEQIEGWKQIASAVQAKGSKFFVQLMHCGRVSASENVPEGGRTIAPSPVQLSGEMYTDTKGMIAHDIPLEMTPQLIEQTQNEFVDAAKNLIRAGVNGVELHSANGYLLEQFLNPKSNLREDLYGGDYKNRARFVIETAKKVVNAIGGDKVGIRLSPYNAFNDMEADYVDLVDLYTYLAEELRKIGLVYIHIADQREAMGNPDFKTPIKKTIKHVFKNTVITGGGVDTKEKAEELLDTFDLIYVGRPFISNPDLVEKLDKGEELKPLNPDLLYTPGAEGYTDY